MSYQQISNLFRSVQRLAFATSQVGPKSPQEKEALRKINDLFQTAHRLIYTADNFGLTEGTAASFKDALEQKADDVGYYIRLQDYNPYEDNLYVLAEKELPAVVSALGQYSPSALPAQNPAKKPQVVNLPEETITPTPKQDVGVGKEKKDDGFYFGPVPHPGPAQLAPSFELPRSEPFPGPGEDLPPAKTSDYDIDTIFKLANKFAQDASTQHIPQPAQKDYTYGLMKDPSGKNEVQVKCNPGTSPMRQQQIKQEIQNVMGTMYPIKFMS